MKIMSADEWMTNFGAEKTVLTDFILPYEHQCVLLASYVKKSSKNIFVIVDDEMKVKEGCERPGKTEEGQGKNFFEGMAENLKGIVYLDRTLLHCIPFLNEKLCPMENQSKDGFNARNKGHPVFEEGLDEEIERHPIAEYRREFEKKFMEFFKAQDLKIKCIDGEKNGTEFFIGLLEKMDLSPFQKNDYRLMVCGEINPPPEKLSDDDEIRRCTSEDFDLIFKLQKDYVEKEVAPRGKNPSDAEISMGLRQILKNQLCLGLFYDDRAVSKANTNAIGIKWVQLGGIYTHPRFRRNYYAWHLVWAICRRAEKAGKRTALFVKDINVPAIRLYEKIGFVSAGKYVIAYY